MARAALLVAVLASGCVTTNTVARIKEPTLPVLIGTTVADLLVVGLISAQIDSFSNGATVASTLAVTAADVGIACILGGCKALRP